MKYTIERRGGAPVEIEGPDKSEGAAAAAFGSAASAAQATPRDMQVLTLWLGERELGRASVPAELADVVCEAVRVALALQEETGRSPAPQSPAPQD